MNGDPIDEGLPKTLEYPGMGEPFTEEVNPNYDDVEDEGDLVRRHEEDLAEVKKQAQILEKKWTSVVRLQRKVLDLESQVSNLTMELENMPVVVSSASSTARHRGAGYNGDPSTWLPRQPCKYSLSGHRQPITSVAFHSVFSVLASSSEDGTIKIWDWELGELERTLKGHTKAVLDVDFGGSGTEAFLASCSSDLTIKIWDPSNEYSNIRTLTGHDHTISSIRFTPAGTHLLSASRDKTVRVWEVKTGYCVRTIYGHSEWVKCVSPSWDSQYVVSGSIDQTARVSNILTGENKLAFVGHDHVVECALFAPKTAYGYLASIEGLKTPAPSPYSQSFEYVATGSRDKTIKIWNTRGDAIATLRGHDNWVRDLAFHPAGRYLLSVSDDRSIRCWDLSQKCRCVKVLSDSHHHFISCIRWASPIASTNDVSPITPLKSDPVFSSPNKSSEDSRPFSTDSMSLLPSKRPSMLSPSPSIRSRYGALLNSRANSSLRYGGSSSLYKPPSSRIFSNGSSISSSSSPFGSRQSSNSSTSNENSNDYNTVNGTNGTENNTDSNPLPNGGGITGSAAYRTPENFRNIRCVIATGSVDLDVKIWM